MTDFPMSRSAHIAALRKSGQLSSAFLAAPFVSLLLYSIYVLLHLAQESGASSLRIDSFSDLVFFLFLILIVMLMGAAPVILAVVFVAYPVFLLLVRFKILNTVSILVASYLTGLLAARLWMITAAWRWREPIEYRIDWTNFLNVVLPAGICALIGGLVFCRMTLWRRPDRDGTSDVSN